jgi:hypothetical protein
MMDKSSGNPTSGEYGIISELLLNGGSSVAVMTPSGEKTINLKKAVARKTKTPDIMTIGDPLLNLNIKQQVIGLLTTWKNSESGNYLASDLTDEIVGLFGRGKK